MNTDDFYPINHNPCFTRFIQCTSYAIGHYGYQFDLKVTPSSLDILNQIQRDRVVFMPNHCCLGDGVAMFALSAYCGETFNYLVSYENFKGLLAKFLQNTGCYSIKRGLADRKSIAYTLKLLRKPAARLVVFAEGGCSFQNDTVMPFRSGGVQLSFQAMNQLVKEEANIPNFYLVPVSLKYRYKKPMDQAIDQTLSDLEQHLQLKSDDKSFCDRLYQISNQILLNLEQQYGLDLPENRTLDWNQRLNNLKQYLIQKCETELGITSYPNLPLRERTYKVQAVLATTEEITPETYDLFNKATFTLLNFDAIYDGYVTELPTPERFLDVLIRFEREIYQIEQPKYKGIREAWLQIGQPLNLKDYFEAYQENKTQTIEMITEEMRDRVQQNLDSLIIK